MTASTWPATATTDTPPATPDNPIPSRIGPQLDDPTGLYYDRADTEEMTTATAGDGWAINGRAAKTTTPAVDEQPAAAVRGLPPFNLRAIAAAGLTVDDWGRIERAAATSIDPLCGHLPGECWPNPECDYWRGVVLGEYDAPAGMEAVVEQARARHAAAAAAYAAARAAA